MFHWFRSKQQDFHDSYEALEENLTRNSRKPLKGFNDQAKKIRQGERDYLKRKQESGEQILEEEFEAIESSKGKKFYTSKQGEDLADESLDKSFWDRFNT